MPRLLSTLIAKLILLLSFASNIYAADLTVNIFGLRNDKGDVHIAIYDNPKAFPDSDHMLREVKKRIIKKKVQHRFTDLKPGNYALATYHDENNNDSFDTNFLGLPTEGYAFSNEAQAFLGPPSFLNAQIKRLNNPYHNELLSKDIINY